MPKLTAALSAERPRTSTAIEGEITTLTATKAQAEAELGRLSAARPALLLDMTDRGDAALEAHDLAAGKASRTIERATAVIGKMQEDLTAARHAERQAELRDVYAKGEAAATDYRRLVEKEYAPAARKAAAALAGMRAALDIVEDANKTLPEGATRIDADAFRHPPFDRGTPPPAEIEVVEWIDSDGNVVRPIFTQRDGVMKPAEGGLRQRKAMRPNPARATWRPNERRYAHSILQFVKLPAVEVDVPAFWPAVAK